MKEETRYLWISELPPNVTQQTLVDLFSSYGRVLNTKIHDAGNLRGAVLSFLDTKTAAKACSASHHLNGQSLISEYCDQSGEPGLQRLKDSSNGKLSEKKSLENGSTSVNNNNSPPNRAKGGCKHEGGGGQPAGKFRILKVWNFPDRSSDSSIQNGLYHEYKRIGKLSGVHVRTGGGVGQSGDKPEPDRHALVAFKRSEDAAQAYELTRSGKSFFGMTLSVERVDAIEEANLQPPLQAATASATAATAAATIEQTQQQQQPPPDEYNARATRTLFVGNLDPKSVCEADLREALSRFGNILDVDIKVQSSSNPGGGNSCSAYAFVQFPDIKSVVGALKRPDAVSLKGQKPKLGFGRSQATDCLWLGNLAETATESFITKTFSAHGRVRDVYHNYGKQRALVYYQQPDEAQKALTDMKNRCLAGKKLQVDFASQKCQKDFIDELIRSGQYSSSGKCRGYKIFEQLFPPEFDRSVGRSGVVMLKDCVKASHRPWRKFRDHHYDAVGDHPRRHDEFSSPYSDQSYADEYGGRGGPPPSRSSRRPQGGGGGANNRHPHGYSRQASSPSGSQKAAAARAWRHGSRSPGNHASAAAAAGAARHSADSSTSSSPVRPTLGSGDLRSLLERSNSRIVAAAAANRRRSTSKGSSSRRGGGAVGVSSAVSAAALPSATPTAAASALPSTRVGTGGSGSGSQRSAADSNRRRGGGSSSDSNLSSDGEAAKSTQDMSLRKLEQEKQMLLAQLANLEDARTDSSASTVGSDAENSAAHRQLRAHRQRRGGRGDTTVRHGEGRPGESQPAQSQPQQPQQPEEPRKQQEYSKKPQPQPQHSPITDSDDASGPADATPGRSGGYDQLVDATIKQLRRESTAAAEQLLLQHQQGLPAGANGFCASPTVCGGQQAADDALLLRDPRLHQQLPPGVGGPSATDQTKEMLHKLLQNLVAASGNASSPAAFAAAAAAPPPSTPAVSGQALARGAGVRAGPRAGGQNSGHRRQAGAGCGRPQRRRLHRDLCRHCVQRRRLFDCRVGFLRWRVRLRRFRHGGVVGGCSSCGATGGFGDRRDPSCAGHRL